MNNIFDYSLKAIGPLATIGIPIYNVIKDGLSNRRTKTRKILSEVIEESIKQSQDSDFVDSMRIKYKWAAVREVSGLNISPENYKILLQTDAILVYSDKTIKRMRNYLKFESDSIKIIRITLLDYLSPAYNFFAPLIFFFYLQYYIEFKKIEPSDFVALQIVSYSSLLIWGRLLFVRVLPFAAVLDLKKKLKMVKK